MGAFGRLFCVDRPMRTPLPTVWVLEGCAYLWRWAGTAQELA